MFMTEDDFQKLLQKNPKLKPRKAKGLSDGLERLLRDIAATSQGESITPRQVDNSASSKSKYHNQKVYVHEDGFVGTDKCLEQHGKIIMTFDSKKEYYRYIQLSELEQAGLITNLERQKKLIIQDKFKYHGRTVSQITYVADFAYIKDGKQIVEDVKGKDRKTGKYRLTEAFKLKWKLLKYHYPEYLFELF